MFLTMGISLYATRLILNALGSTDYGIFNLIAGVIAMLSFLNNAMATSTQRFLSFYQGKNDLDMQRSVFANSLLLHLVIGVVLVAILEIAGLFLFDNFLNIPAERIGSAKTIYHFMSGTVFFTVFAVPFNGSLIAHENMAWVAVVNIVESLLRLATALFLASAAGDRLIIYAIFTMLVAIASFILYAVYCYLKYPECRINHVGSLVNRGLMKELTSFAGWNLFGSLCSVGRNQGLAVLLNLSFGTVINAAYGISNQVSGQLAFFSSTMLRAVNPQIMKSEGANDRERMLRLSMIASKFGFFMMAILAIPCIFEMKAILAFWLKTVPDYTVIFCQLSLINICANQLTIGLQSAIQAVGKVKVYQIIVGSTLLLNLPIAYVLLRTGFQPYSVMWVSIATELIACGFRIVLLQKLASMSVREYFRNVLSKEVIPTLAAIATAATCTTYIVHEWRPLFTIAASATACIAGILLAGLCKDEKAIITKLISKILSFPKAKQLAKTIS
ncbi:Na+-driven multidrug efflux pump [Dyadobacter soli]|uniref:Na+-driven multidrug efflux pump n=2 Tax=Dyadobacter soli TaxID=659014 RepID=A0A1G6YAU5_9BACT|nr:Na+-driven multidrug efflux pump [Dyadobacter soli]